MSPVRVLVVDDSAFMRRRLTSILETAPDLTVAGIARNGEEAIERVRELEPDVITLDITMPRMDGLTALVHIMMERPTPTVMVSSLTQDGAMTTLEALELGAVDFVAKPSGTVSLDIERQAAEIVTKVRAAASARTGRRRSSATLRRQASGERRGEGRPISLRSRRPTRRSGSASLPAGIVAIGVSTGGPQTLLEIIPRLPADLPVPVVMVQHMPATFTASFAERLDAVSAVRVKEAEHNEPILAGTVYVAPGGYQMTLAQSVSSGAPRVRLSDRPSGLTFCPSVDVLFEAVVNLYGRSAVGVLLTGMGNDGADGMVKIRQAGGTTIAESEDTAVVFGMPREAIARGGADLVVPMDEVAEQIMRALREKTR